MDTSDGSGNFSLMISTGGSALDGFLKATKTGNADTYLYPPVAIATDYTGVPIEEVSTTDYQLVSQLLGGGTASQGMIGVEVAKAASATSPVISGATVSSTPAAGKIEYAGSGGLPSTTATSTGSAGIAYLFGVNPGTVSVTAKMSGATFEPVTVSVFAGALTTTIVPE
jgi:hypothetical protein